MHSLIHPLLFAYSCIYVHHFFIDSLMWQPRTSSFMKAKVWECIDLMKLSSPWWLSQVDLWPEDVVDPDDVLLVGVLGVDGDGGTGLDPDVTAVLLDPPVVLSDTLTLIHHWERDIEIYKERERERGGLFCHGGFCLISGCSTLLDITLTEQLVHHMREKRGKMDEGGKSWTEGERESGWEREGGSHQMSCDSWLRAALLLPSLIRPTHTASLCVCVCIGVCSCHVHVSV